MKLQLLLISSFGLRLTLKKEDSQLITEGNENTINCWRKHSQPLNYLFMFSSSFGATRWCGPTEVGVPFSAPLESMLQELCWCCSSMWGCGWLWWEDWCSARGEGECCCCCWWSATDPPIAARATPVWSMWAGVWTDLSNWLLKETNI